MNSICRILACLAIILVAAELAGCISARRGEPLTRPFVASSPKVERGHQVFMRFCNQCHPGGDAGLGPAINNKPLPGIMIKTQVRQGMGRMPSFSREAIPPSDLDAIVAYLQELRHEKRA